MLSFRLLTKAMAQLASYKEKYKNRLSSKTHLYLTQLFEIQKRIMEYLKSVCEDKTIKSNYTAMKCIDFIISAKLDRFNFFTLQKFIEKGQVATKISKFNTLKLVDSSDVALTKLQAAADFGELKITNSMEKVMEFIYRFATSTDADTRILISKGDKPVDCVIKLVCFDHKPIIKEILDQAYTIIFAGGTLHPVIAEI